MPKSGTLFKIPKYVSPDIRDIIFYEEIKEQTFESKCFEICKSCHSCDKDYKLVYIGDYDPRSGSRRLYYAKDRKDQWKYNFVSRKEFGSIQGIYQREYIIPRSEGQKFVDELDYCDNDPELKNDPETYPLSEGYVFRAAAMSQLEQPLNGCYVRVVRTFSKIPVEKSFPTPLENDVIFTETHAACYANKFSYDDPHPDKKQYPNHKLVFKSGIDSTGLVKLYYAANREEQYKYNYTFSSPSIGGSKYSTYERLYVIPRCEFEPEDSCENAGDPDPDSTKHFKCDGSTPVFSSDYVFVSSRLERSNVKELDSCYVFYVKRFSKLCPLTSQKWDSENEEFLSYDYELIPRKDKPDPIPINEDGIVSEVEDVNCCWSAIIRRKIFDPEKVKTYSTYIQYSWPAVLDGVEFMVWNLKNGDQFRAPRPFYLRRAQTLPTKAEITISYSDNPIELPLPISMLPNSITYSCPAFRIQIPACLHKLESFICDYGTDNPDVEQTVGSARDFPATRLTNGDECIDWPENLIVSVKQAPYKGGYRQEVTEIFRPEIVT